MDGGSIGAQSQRPLTDIKASRCGRRMMAWMKTIFLAGAIGAFAGLAAAQQQARAQ
jgi:hypothetical protein